MPGANQRRKASTAQRGYQKRRRTGKAQPSILVMGIFGNSPIMICAKAAKICIGISPQRVQRVLNGLIDRRTSGHLPPKRCIAQRTNPMSLCLRFLWRKYHFDAEGLPDRFSIQRHDAKSLTIGTQGDRCRFAMPVRHAHDDSSMEEEERAIAGMALYVASTLDPNSSVTMGPGLSGSPTRYIGVVKPIHLYLELEAWCQSQDVAKPSFQTLLRALEECRCIRFRKVAGQHANCDICTDFKKAIAATPKCTTSGFNLGRLLLPLGRPVV